ALARYCGSSTPTVSKSEFMRALPSFRRRFDAEAAGQVLVFVPRRPVDVDLFPVDHARRPGLPRGGHDQLLSLSEAPAPLRIGTRSRARDRAVEHTDERRPVSTDRDLRPAASDEDR